MRPVIAFRRRSFASGIGELSAFQAAPIIDVDRAEVVAGARGSSGNPIAARGSAHGAAARHTASTVNRARRRSTGSLDFTRVHLYRRLSRRISVVVSGRKCVMYHEAYQLPSYADKRNCSKMVLSCYGPGHRDCDFVIGLRVWGFRLQSSGFKVQAGAQDSGLRAWNPNFGLLILGICHTPPKPAA